MRLNGNCANINNTIAYYFMPVPAQIVIDASIEKKNRIPLTYKRKLFSAFFTLSLVYSFISIFGSFHFIVTLAVCLVCMQL